MASNPLATASMPPFLDLGDPTAALALRKEGTCDELAQEAKGRAKSNLDCSRIRFPICIVRSSSQVFTTWSCIGCFLQAVEAAARVLDQHFTEEAEIVQTCQMSRMSCLARHRF